MFSLKMSFLVDCDEQNPRVEHNRNEPYRNLRLSDNRIVAAIAKKNQNSSSIERARTSLNLFETIQKHIPAGYRHLENNKPIKK